MASKKDDRLPNAISNLRKAVEAFSGAGDDDELQFLALSKAFEIAVEYSWKELKRRVEDEGLEAESPKSAVRQAAKLGLISNPEKWLMCINARNSSVHDYFGISKKEFASLAEEFAGLEIRVK